MEARPLSFDDAESVYRRMRAADRREIAATRWTLDPRQLARETLDHARFGCVGCYRAAPVAVVAAVEVWPGVYQVGMCATDAWPSIAFGLTRWVKRRMVPALQAAGAHRAECRSIAGHLEAHRWLARLGARREAVLDYYGKHGETFHLFAWTKADAAWRDQPAFANRGEGRR